MAAYLAPAGRGEAAFTERGSRFLGVCAPVGDEVSAKDLIASVRANHPGASHNVFAYRLRDGTARFSDDGEPSGTAGMPVLEVLVRRNVADAAAVVTRYFGGTLLGAGGLVRAYARAASLALDAAGIAEMRLWREGTVTVPYPLYEQTARLLKAYGARGAEPDFSADVTMRFQVLEDGWDALCEALRELTAGGAAPEPLRTLYMP